MRKIKSALRESLSAIHIENAERGATTLEYAVVAVIVIGIVFVAMEALGYSIAGAFTRAASSLGG